MKRIVVLLIFLLLNMFVNVKAQYFPRKQATSAFEINEVTEKLKNTKSVHLRLPLILKLANCYLFKAGEFKSDLDSAYQLAKQAKNLSLRIKSKAGIGEATLIIAGYYVEKQELLKAKSMLNSVTDTNRIKLLSFLGDHYLAHSTYQKPPLDLQYYDSARYYYNKKLALSKVLKSPVYIASSLASISYSTIFSQNQRRYPLIEDYNAIYKQRAYLPDRIPPVYLIVAVSSDYIKSGEYAKALETMLVAIKVFNESWPDQDKARIYRHSGNIYRLIEKYEISNFYYNKLLITPKKYDQYMSIYNIANFACSNLRALKRVEDAVALMKDLYSRYKPRSAEDSIFLQRALGMNYAAKNQFYSAEQCFLEAIKLSNQANFNTSAPYLYLADTYMRSGRFKNALNALKMCEEAASGQHVRFIANLYTSRAKVDSALGDFKSGLSYLLKSKKISDSIFTASKEKNTQELEVQYQTQRKELQLKQRAENIAFLQQKSILQQKNADLQYVRLKQAAELATDNRAILALHEKDILAKNKELTSLNSIALLQKDQLNQAIRNKRVTITVIGLLIIIAGLTFRQFRLKRRGNSVITEKNEMLRHLLTEKEWLLKEVHHRVKNNLQTIINLLESQSDYLKEPAYTAIETSKNRIFTISLLHNKLYQAEESSSVDMSIYLAELISFLRDTFSADAVSFTIDVDPIRLDAATAIPIGLIVNELVTNALKHAFHAQANRTIDVSFKENESGVGTLVVADNGSGLATNALFESPATLGLKLVKGLTRQLEANISISWNNGANFVVSDIPLSLHSHPLQR